MLRLIRRLKSSSYIIKENTADDTSPTPHTGNGSQIQIPSESIRSPLQHSKALRIRHQLGSVKGRKYLLHQFRLIIYR